MIGRRARRRPHGRSAGRGGRDGRGGRALRARPGFTLVELAVVVLIIAILARLALMGYHKLWLYGHAAGALADVHAVRVAAYAYNQDTNRWPPDVNRGVIPPELVPYLQGVEFDRPLYKLDWDYWALPDGTPSRPQSGTLVGISVVTTDEEFGDVFLRVVGDVVGKYTISEHYTFIVIGT